MPRDAGTSGGRTHPHSEPADDDSCCGDEDAEQDHPTPQAPLDEKVYSGEVTSPWRTTAVRLARNCHRPRTSMTATESVPRRPGRHHHPGRERVVRQCLRP